MKASFPLPDIVLKDVRAALPRDVMRQLAEALERKGGVDAAGLTLALNNAEELGGSMIGDGVAVVSARVPNQLTGHRICGFALLARPIAFRGLEKASCDMVFVMATPESQAQEYLRDLSSIIRTLRDRDFVERLRAAPNAERAAGLFRARDLALAQAA